jgi:hypothetical protein
MNGDDQYARLNKEEFRLIDRLAQSLQRLERAKSVVSNDDLEQAIASLREDLAAIRIYFPYIYGLPPLESKKK